MAHYKGRFAPTPSGPMHLGTLLAAVGSFLQARSQRGEWHVRIDDIDPPREAPGAADSILKTLDIYGLHWDASVVYQSQRLNGYQEALERLIDQGDVFECTCSRKEIERVAKASATGVIYPGTCRHGLQPGARRRKSMRLRAEDRVITVNDHIQGKFSQNIYTDVGDYIVKRSDGLFAYHLATVVDDGLDVYTEIVRGQDLLSVTPQQIYLQEKLGIPTPNYAHLPLLMNIRGKKLSKSTQAEAIDTMDQAKVYGLVLQALGLNPPPSLNLRDGRETLDWAIKHWNLSAVPGKDRIIR